MAFCFHFCLLKRSITQNMQYAAPFISTSSVTRKTENSDNTFTTSQLKMQARLKYIAFQIHMLFICIFLFQKHSCWDSIFPSRNKNTNSTTFVSKLLKKKKQHAWMRYDEQGFCFQVSSSLAKKNKICVDIHTHTQFLQACKKALVPLWHCWECVPIVNGLRAHLPANKGYKPSGTQVQQAEQVRNCTWHHLD